MKQNRKLWPLIVLVVAAVGGFLLRRGELANGYDAAGLPVQCWQRYVLAGLSVVAVLFAAVVCLRLTKRPAYLENFGRCAVEFGTAVLAAAAVLAASGLQFWQTRGSAGTQILWLLGVVAALCLAITAVARFQGKKPFLALHLLPAIFLIALLIVQFRVWSVDPVIPDYCYSLFAMIASAIGVFQLGGFCFDAGKRRMSAFWCLIGAYFCIVVLADGGAAARLLMVGLALYLGQNACALLRDGTA